MLVEFIPCDRLLLQKLIWIQASVSLPHRTKALAMEDPVFQHVPGAPLTVQNAIPVQIEKEKVTGENGEPLFRCGFRIGGGIDQDPTKSPHGYKDQGIYVTGINQGTPAHRSGLHMHDKILQVNGHDFTMVTHAQACDLISKYPVLNILVARKESP